MRCAAGSALGGEAREQLERLARSPQDDRDEALDAVLAGPLDEPLEQRGGGAAALPVVDDGDRDLGLGGLVGADVAGDPDRAPLAVEGDQRLVVVVVDLGQVGEVAVGEPVRAGRRSAGSATPGSCRSKPAAIASLSSERIWRSTITEPSRSSLGWAHVRLRPPCREHRERAGLRIDRQGTSGEHERTARRSAAEPVRCSRTSTTRGRSARWLHAARRDRTDSGRRDPLTPPRRLQYVGRPPTSRRSAPTGATGWSAITACNRIRRPRHRLRDRPAAVALIPQLPCGTYEGFDIVPQFIRWCRREITSRHPNFGFELADVRNRQYNRNGGRPAAEYEFPFADAGFDLALAASVFTHMEPDGVRRYLTETLRVLRPGGTFVCTFFLLDDDVEELLAEAGGVQPRPRAHRRRRAPATGPPTGACPSTASGSTSGSCCR